MRYPGLFGDHAGTMVLVMRQAGLHRAAHCATDCVKVYADDESYMVRHLISSRLAGRSCDVIIPLRAWWM